MQINFFEEFPSADVLQKAKLIKAQSTVFLAAKSHTEFKKLGSEIVKINPLVEPAYWPILPDSYWFSPFSNQEELEKMLQDLGQLPPKTKVLIDLELPLLNLKLFAKNFKNFKKNKKLIEKILTSCQKNNLIVYTAQYPNILFSEQIFKLFGLVYSEKTFPHTKIYMFYTSMMKNSLIVKLFQTNIKKINNTTNLNLGLGTIEVGILGNEPILSVENLERDLDFAKLVGAKNVTIFRLGGLNEKYAQIINSQ